MKDDVEEGSRDRTPPIHNDEESDEDVLRFVLRVLLLMLHGNTLRRFALGNPVATGTLLCLCCGLHCSNLPQNNGSLPLW